jgi:hypothetical protein
MLRSLAQKGRSAVRINVVFSIFKIARLACGRAIRPFAGRPDYRAAILYALQVTSLQIRAGYRLDRQDGPGQIFERRANRFE